MENAIEQLKNFQIDENGVILFTTNATYGCYNASLFLCEVYEKLGDYEKNGSNNGLMNFEDPHGAFVLLSDFFEKTNYLQNTSLKDFEEYRSKYDIALDYKKCESAKIYQDASSPSMVAALKCFASELDQWRKFDKKLIDNTEFNSNVFRYYSCRTMIDFVFSLVHYLVYNDYKIQKCIHCGKLFATNNLKYNYCDRKSPLKGYDNKTCGEAKKAIWDKLQKRKIKLKKRLNIHPLKLEEFIVDTDNREDYIRKYPTADNLQNYSDYLFIECESIYRKYERCR